MSPRAGPSRSERAAPARYNIQMPPTPIVVLEIDDNTSPQHPPFTNDVSMWSFADDLNLRTRTAAATFRTLHEACGRSTFRGYPDRAARGTVALLDSFIEASQVTWLTAAELAGDRPWLSRGDSPVERSLRLVFEAVDAAARHFGPERVRLVFAFV